MTLMTQNIIVAYFKLAYVTEMYQNTWLPEKLIYSPANLSKCTFKNECHCKSLGMFSTYTYTPKLRGNTVVTHVSYCRVSLLIANINIFWQKNYFRETNTIVTTTLSNHDILCSFVHQCTRDALPHTSLYEVKV